MLAKEQFVLVKLKNDTGVCSVPTKMWDELFERPFVQVTVGSGKPIEYERTISWQNIKFHLRQSDLEMLTSRFSAIGIARKKPVENSSETPWWDYEDFEEKIQGAEVQHGCSTRENTTILGYRFSINRVAYDLLKNKK
jgi:hypothetical protein